MVPSTRRWLLRASGTLGTVALAGCLDDAGPTPTPGPCSPTDPPYPTDAAADPQPYPERPDELTRASVRSFVEAYAEAYRYNSTLAKHPDKIGRLNTFDARVADSTVEVDGSVFVVEVSGNVTQDIVDRDGPTPETPTETPLPMGHGQFSAVYEVTDRRVRREGVTVECW